LYFRKLLSFLINGFIHFRLRIDMAVENICGERIREARKEKGLNQIDLVTAIHDEFGIKMDSTSLGRIERNERGVWDFELVAFSKILDVNINWLLKIEKEKQIESD